MTVAVQSIRDFSHLEWFVVHTFSRHEKSVCEQLRGREIETFLPLYRSSKRWKNGQIGGQIPLFPGYLFVRIDIQNQLPVLQTSGVAKFVGFGSKPAAVPDDQIAELEAAVTKGINVSPHPFLNVGDRVRIQYGPMAGLTGILTRDKRGHRVILSVELISRSISVELDSADVEAV
jgi:transcription antitermination factor NusG